MKIAIPSDEKSMNSNVCVSFGRTPYFMIYDTETKQWTTIDNSAAASQSGAGIKAAQVVVDNGCEAVITVRLGKNSANVLDAAKIKYYKSVFGSAKINIEKYLNGELEPLTDIQEGFSYHGGR